MQQKLNQLEINSTHDNPAVNIPDSKLNSDNVYSAYPIINTNTIPQNNLNINANDYLDDFNDGYLNSNLTSPPMNTNNKPIHYNEQANNYLNNIEEKSLNTEKRVLELERQLEKMRKLLNDDSEKNIADSNNNNHYHEVNQLILDDTNFNNNNNKKPKINIESDTTLRDIDLDQELFSNQESESNLQMVYEHDQHQHFLKPRKKRSKTKKSSRHQANTRLPPQPQSQPIQQVNENYFLKSFNSNHRSKSVEDNFLQRSNSRSQCHYRLKLGDIPFVVGKV